MALRLTGKTLQPTSPAATPARATVNAESLVFQARAVLADGDVPAFSALFARAAELTDPHPRFHARLALLDAGLSVTAQVSEGMAARVYVAVAEAALTMLEETAAEPTILNLAGVALYELWSLDAAQTLFRAARRLDPSLQNVDRNLDEVGRRKRAGRRTRPLNAAVPGLARRATSVANRAKPATGLSISLCMIVRDEEQMLPRCLAAAAPAVDEIIVVDTGSTDATVEIARSFGAKVIEFPWTGSFSDARNVSFEAATGDWVMYLDADEILVTEDIEQLRTLSGRTWREAFYLVETSYTGELGDGGAIVNNALRLFRNRPEYRFKDRLHEQIAHTLPTYIPGRVEQTAVRVTHYGYLGAVRDAKEKSQRNVELLRKQAAESPKTPFLHFNLGSEYIVAGDLSAALEELKTARTLLTQDDSITRCEYAPSLFTRLVMVLRMCGRVSEAHTAAADGLELFPQFTDLVLAQGRLAEMQGDTDQAVALYRRCIEMGDAPSRYGPQLGSGTFLPRLALGELHLSRDEVAEARTELQWCVDHHPEFLAVAGPYAHALLRDRVAPGEVSAKLESLDALPASVRLTVAAVLHRAGAAQEAEQQYRLALDAAPANARARTSLGELLLGRGEWDDAAEQAAAVPTDDPYAGLAVRIELCGLVGRAGSDRVQAALTRAEAAGLSAAERTVFSTWAAVAAGVTETDPLPVSGAPLLGVVLETLLSGADGERFVALLPVLHQSRLPRREQRELLAQMYLSHGLVAQAAQEWLAVASEAPDVRALLGLAQVALHQGMAEDAVNFATGALELDPSSAQAKALLSAIPTVVAA
ncbi:MAG: glycosyltransferase [Solirubrobacteraceae bacterium]